MRLALLTCDSFATDTAAEGDWYVANILQEDQLLSRALAELKHTTRRVSWSDASVDWRSFDAAIFRSTWDYFHRFPEFDCWLAWVNNQIPLINSESLVRWNVDKHYLLDLQAAGLPIVPSIVLEPGSTLALSELLGRQGWQQAVIKPCISGAARHTHRVDRENADRIDQQLRSLRQVEAFLVQPFQTAILDQGEETLVMAGDQVTHAVRKRAKEGDFRVQDDFGGTVQACQVQAEQIELAERAMRACAELSIGKHLPAYGRVDMVRSQTGQWQIMEVELIEPELWMRFNPDSARLIANAIDRLATLAAASRSGLTHIADF